MKHGAVLVLLAACGARATLPANRPEIPRGIARGGAVRGCDPTGVWRVESNQGTLDVTIDPSQLQIDLESARAMERDIMQVGFDVAACRIYVLRRWERLHGAEGYEDAEYTLRLDFQAGDGDRTVRGAFLQNVLDPRSLTSERVRGVARRITPRATAVERLRRTQTTAGQGGDDLDSRRAR
jgi:hypothetical protein